MPPTPTDYPHTPEPWNYDPMCADRRCDIRAPGNPYILVTAYEDNDSGNAKANAARIVACVNACAGMADPGADIAAIRATMRGVLTMLEDCADGRDPASNDYIACTNLRAALALLGDDNP